MALADNLRHGQNAVKHVKEAGVLASNKMGDRLKAAGGVKNVIAQGGFDATAHTGVGVTRHAGVRAMTVSNLRGTAEYTKRTKFGNCWEQAAIAFVYLFEKGVRSLDYMAFDNDAGGYDHVWVGIGLDQGWQRKNLRSWGADAVWCDPWQGDGMTFSIDDLVKGKVRNLNAIYKCNTAERVEAGNPESMCRVD